MSAVVLDTDIGTDIDDNLALAMLLRCQDLDLVGCANSVHAAMLYSWMRPPSRSRR